MGTTAQTDVRKKVKRYIDTADDVTVEMIHAMLKVQRKQTIAPPRTVTPDEIERRIKDYEEGKIIPVSFEQIKSNINRRFNQRNPPVK